MLDFAVPQGNEQEMVGMARRLGITEICFLYTLSDYSKKPKLASSQVPGVTIKQGILAAEKEIAKARQVSSIVVVKASETARHVIENNKGIILCDFELDPKKDFVHQRRSGINHIIAALAAKNSNTIAFSLATVLASATASRATILGRMMANITVCRKYRANMVFASFAASPYHLRAPKDLVALCASLGAQQKDMQNL